ncbi:hypothetical protein REH81_27065, partial [Vibrio rotiferianus]
IDTCEDCGNDISQGAVYCRSCKEQREIDTAIDDSPDIEGFQDWRYKKLKKQNKYSDDEIYAIIDKEIEELLKQ